MLYFQRDVNFIFRKAAPISGIYIWQLPKTPNSAVRYIDEMIIYLL